MLTIRHTCSNRIIARAFEAEGKPLVALLLPGTEDREGCETARQLQARLDAEPGAIIVYNQQADGVRTVDRREASAARFFIEVRRDTRDVPGLQAYHKQDRGAEALEFFQE